MTTGTCVIGDKPHAATVGYLCEAHFGRLGVMLRDIEEQALMLSAVPSMQIASGSRGGSLASHRAPARLDVIVANDRRRGTGIPVSGEPDPWGFDDTASILDVLGSWARVVREERDLQAADSVTVTGERDLLTRHLPWIAAQPWVDEAYSDLRGLLAQLKASNGTRAEQPYSPCPRIIDGQACTGQVWIRDELQAVWRRYPDRCAATYEQAPGAAVCNTCGTKWETPAERARLKRMCDDTATELARPLTEDGEPMKTAEELVKEGLVSSVNNVRVQAHRRGIAKSGAYYDPRSFGKQPA